MRWSGRNRPEESLYVRNLDHPLWAEASEGRCASLRPPSTLSLSRSLVMGAFERSSTYPKV